MWGLLAVTTGLFLPLEIGAGVTGLGGLPGGVGLVRTGVGFRGDNLSLELGVSGESFSESCSASGGTWCTDATRAAGDLRGGLRLSEDLSVVAQVGAGVAFTRFEEGDQVERGTGSSLALGGGLRWRFVDLGIRRMSGPSVAVERSGGVTARYEAPVDGWQLLLGLRLDVPLGGREEAVDGH